MDNRSTIRIKLGTLEIECAASEEFLKAELPALMQTIAQMSAVQPPPLDNPDSKEPEPKTPNEDGELLQGTTRTVAAKLGAKSNTDLVLAACVRLAQQNKPQCSRKDILDSMKEATGFYRNTYSNNLSKALDTLVKQGKLLEPAKEIYALSVDTKKELDARLRNGTA
jgi:hypothetical protein